MYQPQDTLLSRARYLHNPGFMAILWISLKAVYLIVDVTCLPCIILHKHVVIAIHVYLFICLFVCGVLTPSVPTKICCFWYQWPRKYPALGSLVSKIIKAINLP